MAGSGVALTAALVFFYVNLNDGLRIAYGNRKSEMFVTWHSGSQLVPPIVVYRQIVPSLPTSTLTRTLAWARAAGSCGACACACTRACAWFWVWARACSCCGCGWTRR